MRTGCWPTSTRCLGAARARGPRTPEQCLATCGSEALGTSTSRTPTRRWPRSEASARDTAEADAVAAKAEHAGAEIADPEDRELFVADLAAGPWYDGVSS